jgi:hypothetical protein
MTKKNINLVQFSAYETGVKRPSVGKEYTLNGKNNINFKKYRDSYDDSPTNSFIIKTIVNYIVGKGLVDKSGSLKPHEFLAKGDLRKIVLDFKRDGSAFIQSINFEGNVVKFLHTPNIRMGLNVNIDARDERYMEVDGYWYCWDYTREGEFPPRPYPMFSKYDNDNPIEILHLKILSSEPYFPFPDWFSGFKSAKIESALIDDAVNHVMRGFQGKTIININSGGLMDEDEKKEISKKIGDDYTGTENGDGVIISVNESANEAIIIDTIEPRGRNEQFVTYDETCEIKLMAAHQAMNILFSRPGSNGFSSNADEIATATDSLYLSTINPIRDELIEYLNEMFRKINPNADIDFINFGQEKIIVSDTNITNE